MRAAGAALAPALLVAAAAVALGAVIWLTRRTGTTGPLALQAGAAAGSAAVDAAAGVVVGIGQAVGIPQTSETACQAAIREGRTWDASFLCPAGTWLGSIFNPTPTPTPPRNTGGATGTW